MIRKINNPNLDVKNGKIFGSERNVFKGTRFKNKGAKDYHLGEYKYKDKTFDYFRPLDSMTKREIEYINIMTQYPTKYKEMLKNNEAF